MADLHRTSTTAAGVTYAARARSYFERRGLDRFANFAHLWALGVGAVVSGSPGE